MTATYWPDLSVWDKLEGHLEDPPGYGVNKLSRASYGECQTHPVDGEEQTLKVCELGGGDAEKARRVVIHGTSSTPVPVQSVCAFQQSAPRDTANNAGVIGTHRWK